MATRSLRSEHAPVSLRVPFAASSVAHARQQLKLWMTAQGSPNETVEDGRVVISELVANAIRHAEPLSDGTLLITWKVDSHGLLLAVTDGGAPTRPRMLDAPSSALAGRGMSIVDSLTERWWAEQSRSRCTVHAVLPLR